MSEEKITGAQMLGLGKEITLPDGNKYTLMPLTLLDGEEIQEKIKETGGEVGRLRDLHLTLYYMLRKKQPDMTYDKLGEMIPLSYMYSKEFLDVLKVINELNGGNLPKNEVNPTDSK